MEDGEHGRRFEVGPAEAGERLDRVLPARLRAGGIDVSRSLLQQWIRDGLVTVNGAAVKPRHSLVEGEKVDVAIPEKESREIAPEPIPLTILHEDEDIIVIDKAPGLVVHPGSGNPRGTLVNALLHHCEGGLCELAGEDRPGIVHRLDKDTSGCLVAAKSERAYRSLVEQFSRRETGKEYIAVTRGIPVEREGTIEARIGRNPGNRQKMAVIPASGGKEAITDYRVLRSDEEERWACLSCIIHTGRTHQIRVHLKECLRTPILGDEIYGNRSRETVRASRLMLHAWKLSFRHPASGEVMRFEAQLPREFDSFL
jgi:23S rRNA pseudouridine1911/1915/1917 synthase